MRIRKNSRRVVPEGTPPNTSFLVCKLNCSPWNDPSVVSEFFQDDSTGSFPFKGPLSNKCPASDSIPKVEPTMELTFEYMGPLPPEPEPEPEPAPAPAPAPAPVVNLGEERDPIEVHQVASQPEGKRDGSHLLKYLRPAPTKIVSGAPPKKLPPRPPLPTPARSKKKMGRPKKQRSSTRVASGAAYSKSSDYYYYTGYKFGGSSSSRRRGENKVSGNNNNDNDNDNNNYSSAVNVVQNGGRNCNNAKDLDSTSFVNLITSEEDSSDDERDRIVDYKKKDKVVPDVVGESVDDEELDYINDDIYYNNKDYGVARKKPRKPIKARSLKSLM